MSILRRRALIAEGGMPYWDTITEDWDYIIDQTGKYENPIIVNKKNLYGDKLSSIASIRDLSKLVVGYYDETSAKLIWEPLDSSGKTIVKHPTSAYTINMKVSDYIAEHPTADVFMKLPEFWWRCWNIDGNSDTVAFKFVTEEPTDSNNWFHWDGNIFIGVYKGHIDEVNNVKLLRSISGVTVSNALSWKTYYDSARNKGNGYRCVTYEAHQIMALLFFGYYNEIDTHILYSYIIGDTNTGHTDSIGIMEPSQSKSYHGLENWWAGKMEYVDNLLTLDTIGTIGILDIYGGTKYESSGYSFKPFSYPGYMRLGPHADLFPDRTLSDAATTYADKCEIGDQKDLIAARGGFKNDYGEGITSIRVSFQKEVVTETSITSRLQYEGNNEQYNGLNPPAITVSSYTIDQTGPYTTKPTDMITFNTDNKVIFDIRANSDFYACENKDWGTDIPEFIKMSKTDKLKTTRGTTLDANNYDIFMKLPEFWWKCENVDNNEDKVKFSFTMINPNNNTWHHWDGKTFIGVYKSYYNNSRIYSRSGVTLIDPSPNTTIDALKQSARNRGNGFQLVTYEAQQMIALLEFGYLASVSKSGFYDYKGYGQTQTTGILDSSGFSSGYVYSADNNKSWYNFWGLENWLSYSNYDDEVLDNLVTNRRDGKVCADILDYNGNVVRSVYCDSVTAMTSYSIPAVTKLALGEYGDILPKSGISSTNGVRCYDTNNYIHDNATGYIFKKGYRNFVSFNAEKYNTPSSYENRSRLLYKGNYTIGEEFQV